MLLLGNQNCGKSLLLKRLQDVTFGKEVLLNIRKEIPSTIPTVGTNLATLTISKRKSITIRELGGTMSPIWPSYYKSEENIMFMIDINDRTQTSSAACLLLSMLADDEMESKNILILLNKKDVNNAMSRREIDAIFRLSDIISNAKQKITVYDCNLVTGDGIMDIVSWLSQSNPD